MCRLFWHNRFTRIAGEGRRLMFARCGSSQTSWCKCASLTPAHAAIGDTTLSTVMADHCSAVPQPQESIQAHHDLLMIIDPHASPSECIRECMFFVEEVIERVERVRFTVVRAGFLDGEVGGE
jgi:hypothetical protein